MKKSQKVAQKYNNDIALQTDINIDFKDDSRQMDVSIKDLLNIVPIPAAVMAGMSVLPSDYAYWSSISEELETHRNRMKHDYDMWHADKYEEVVNKEGQKTTETYRETLIMQKFGDEQKVKLSEISETESMMRRIKILLKSLEMKMEMLRSIGGLLKEEWETSRMGETIQKSDNGKGSLEKFKKNR